MDNQPQTPTSFSLATLLYRLTGPTDCWEQKLIKFWLWLIGAAGAVLLVNASGLVAFPVFVIKGCKIVGVIATACAAQAKTNVKLPQTPSSDDTPPSST
jgi:hypothetical protein